MEKKTCSKCGAEKSMDEFSINKANRDGHEYHCKDCKKEKAREARARRSGKHLRVEKKTFPRERTVAARKPICAVTRATPEQIIAELRRGMAIDIIETIRAKYGI